MGGGEKGGERDEILILGMEKELDSASFSFLLLLFFFFFLLLDRFKPRKWRENCEKILNLIIS